METGTRIEVLLEFGNLWLHNNSIVQVHINEGVHIRLREAEKLMETISGLSRYTSRPVIVDLRHIESIDTAAKLYFLNERTDNHNQCMAMVIASPLGCWAANISLLFKHTGCPTKYFTSDEAAFKWAQRFLSEESSSLQPASA